MHLYFNGPKSAFLQDISLRPEWLPILPSYATALDCEPRIAKVSFGEGYEQRSPDGINSMPLVFNVTFTRRRLEIARAIQKFFAGDKVVYIRQPYEFFWWTPPAPNDQKALKFVCEKWTMPYEEYNAFTIAGTFRQVFDPG